MPRLPRNYNDTQYFHVITQGIKKEFIFNYPEDIKYYIKLMYELKKDHNIRIISYCIMNNHSHILIETNKISNLSKYMQRLNTKYGKYYNKKYNRVGYVFRDRFKSEGIYNEEHLYNCIKYIYNNPVNAGICTKPEDYPYSNYKPIKDVGKINQTFIDIKEDQNNVITNIIDNFLIENNINIKDLEQNRVVLKKTIAFLKENYNFSLRSISEELNINREKIRKLYKSSVKQNRPQ